MMLRVLSLDKRPTPKTTTWQIGGKRFYFFKYGAETNGKNRTKFRVLPWNLNDLTWSTTKNIQNPADLWIQWIGFRKSYCSVCIEMRNVLTSINKNRQHACTTHLDLLQIGVQMNHVACNSRDALGKRIFLVSENTSKSYHLAGYWTPFVWIVPM